MPSPIPTLEKIATFAHSEFQDCEGPVKAIRRRWWSWKKDFICQKCGANLNRCPMQGLQLENEVKDVRA